jgi:bifunctional DNA-binding transcriptional regulator/antitoxin component of YhaV-PrlF toxin-antitoxin module
MTIIGESRLYENFKLYIPKAVKNLIDVCNGDMIQFIVDENRVYLQKKIKIPLRVFDSKKHSFKGN